MKKVLSVLLAAAMVMGMSVSAFAAADKVFAANANNDEVGVHACDLGFKYWMEVIHSENNMNHGDKKIQWAWHEEAFEDMRPGDNLYFPIVEYLDGWVADYCAEGHNFENTKAPSYVGKYGETAIVGKDGERLESGNHWAWTYTEDAFDRTYEGAIDKDWSINIKGNEYVVNAYFVAETANSVYSTKAKDLGNDNYPKYVCVEIADELDNLKAVDATMYMYIADMDSDCTCDACDAGHVARNCKSLDVYMNYSVDNETIKYVDFDFTNDADLTAKWVVAKNDKGTATFDFEDGAYFTVKMVSEEEVILNLSTAYDKAVDALFGYDADLSFYNFKGTKDAFTKTGELFIEADEDTFVYEIVDGKIVEIEAEYVEEYKVANTSKAKAGWVIETKELGYYIVSDIEAEIEVEAEVEAPVEADKANPETGAADFVGAAVAMAVVSVAAAGALALKK